MDLVLSQNDLGLGRDVEQLELVVADIEVELADDDRLVVMMGRCSFVDVGLDLVQLGSVRHRGNLGCSSVHRMSHHRTGLMCHMDLYILVHLMVVVDIVAVEQVVGELVERLASGHHWLGIY